MKVWITRPTCDEVFTGGLRRVLLWVDKPRFDQRPSSVEFELYDPDQKKYLSSIWRQEGWTSEAGSVQAKPFLKQNREILEQVWALICDSVRSDQVANSDVTDFEAAEVFMDARHEAKCDINWKRFLAEVDLKSETVTLTDVEVVMPDSKGVVNLPLTPELAIATHFFDEDISRPFDWYAPLGRLEKKRDRIW
jgi:hypothetical protein